ncbi:N-acetylneuraminate synthase family protein [Bacillus sp. SPARC3]|uniref:N-acetylneuraminate synthase family protein n=1 Tax=Bacillus sp. SPARC3 TaxID=2841275 RepID=UPI001C933C3C|nr:N-acetylneuraminate synthase family protein [Bacillus sp. SPARC3]MBY4602683.1 N-acetylneuraminate synthase family protein [Bacillus sp. SPARC3]
MESNSISEEVKVIAEIANAHQGKEENLKTLIKAAAESGADGVKFQWFKYDCIATPCFFAYESYIELFLNEDVWKSCVAYGKRLGLEIWVDIFDSWGAELFLHLQHDIDGIKLPTTILQSTEIMKTIGMTEKPVLIGVGGWYEDEIDQMVSLVKQHMKNQLILMHGFQGYPTKLEDINLKRVQHLKNRYNVQIGFADHIDADHPLAVDLPVYAYFSGAAVIEKHITLNRAAKGFDYYSSLEPNEFKVMTDKLQQAQNAAGSTEVNESERKYLHDSSLRVTANRDIKKGEIITLGKTSYKRCGNKNALMPLQAEDSFPQVATADLSLNQPITSNEIKSPRIAIAVICRLKSTRLPKKALLPIYEIPSVERCLINCLAVPGVHEVVLATSNLPEDDPLEGFTLNGKVRIVRGAPENVAERMLEAAALTKADIIIRVTGDCPAVSPEVLQYLIDRHLQKGADYTQELSSSAGISGNIITVEALQRLVQQPKPLTHTEYLSFYFLNNPSLFSINQVSLPEALHYPSWRLTLDEPKDLELFEQIYQNLNVKNEPLYFSRIRDYLSENQHITKINQDVSTKWIYQTSLVEEINKATRLPAENK